MVHGVLGIAAIGREAIVAVPRLGLAVVEADRVAPLLAVDAVAAALVGLDGHPVSDREVGDTGADGYDLAAVFVAGDKRPEGRHTRPAVPDDTQQKVQQFCFPTMSSAVSVLNTINQKGSLKAGAQLHSADIGNDLSKAYTSLLIHPLVALALTLVFVRYMMTIFGADSSDLTKMISKVI